MSTVATLTPGDAVLSFAGNAAICSTDVGVLVLLTRNNLPSSLLRATALPVVPIVAVVTVAVGLVLSITIALLAPSELAAPGVGKVNVAFSGVGTVAFLIVPPANASESVAL